MRQLQTKPFDWFVGVYSLEELVTKDTRVCVVNILGNESRKVTPVSHAYSGGNVVAGVQYGREGALETPIGDIPVYPSVREVIDAGLAFDCGVIYLPPVAVAQAVSELVTYNPDLRRIIIVTEKVPTHDSRNLRMLCQEAGVDVIGCNCLGVANVWDHVRVGGALGGDHPEETLQPGSVAIHSNSGNFTTTIAEYLRTTGFGISTAVSSGKDVYVHFALPEFLYAAQNDPRTKAVALYVELGGYYEQVALRMIEDRVFCFNKPIIVCTAGRWKSGLARACGHAGAMAGSGDDAASKEKWFDDYFGVPVFDPDNPRVSKRGVRVDSLQAIPEAMRRVYERMDEAPDFEAKGDLSLKPWFADNLIRVPADLDVPLVTPQPPYDEQLAAVSKQVGAQPLRRTMRDASGASRMRPDTLVAELHGDSVLELSQRSLEDNIYFALSKELPDERERDAFNLLLNAFLQVSDDELETILRARRNGATPNAAIASVIATMGDGHLMHAARDHAVFIIDAIRDFGIDTAPENVDADELEVYITRTMLTDEAPDERSPLDRALIESIRTSDKDCAALDLCRRVLDVAERKERGIRDQHEFLLASVAVCVLWGPMLRKRVTRQAVENAITHLSVIARLVACSVTDPTGNAAWQKLATGPAANLTESFSRNAFRIVFGREPRGSELDEFTALAGLTITNGPGTLSAKGAKESVSARNHIPTAYLGFLANTGFAHGGNGFEAVEYLLDRFEKAGLNDPGDPEHGIDVKALASDAAAAYGELKKAQKAAGALRATPIPCINHPVFKGQAVNIDPREAFIRERFAAMGVANVFLDFYHELVTALHDQGVTRNVFCVNIDAVLAVIALKLAWTDLRSGDMTRRQLQDVVFTLFLIGRVIGIAAEINDHRDRGLDMDCRTPQSEITFVL